MHDRRPHVTILPNARPPGVRQAYRRRAPRVTALCLALVLAASWRVLAAQSQSPPAAAAARTPARS